MRGLGDWRLSKVSYMAVAGGNMIMVALRKATLSRAICMAFFLTRRQLQGIGGRHYANGCLNGQGKRAITHQQFSHPHHVVMFSCRRLFRPVTEEGIFVNGKLDTGSTTNGEMATAVRDFKAMKWVGWWNFDYPTGFFGKLPKRTG